MITQLYEYTKSFELYTLKRVNCTACELYLIKAVIEKKRKINTEK